VKIDYKQWGEKRPSWTHGRKAVQAREVGSGTSGMHRVLREKQSLKGPKDKAKEHIGTSLRMKRGKRIGDGGEQQVEKGNLIIGQLRCQFQPTHHRQAKVDKRKNSPLGKGRFHRAEKGGGRNENPQKKKSMLGCGEGGKLQMTVEEGLFEGR